MRIKFVSLFSALFLSTCAAQGVPAQEAPPPGCGSAEGISSILEENYGEVQTWDGLTINGMLAHLYTNTETGTWTFWVEAPNGNACLVENGVLFEFLSHQPEGDPA